jgi:hypothetical protein
MITGLVKGEANEKQATHWECFAREEYTSYGIDMFHFAFGVFNGKSQ